MLCCIVQSLVTDVLILVHFFRFPKGLRNDESTRDRVAVCFAALLHHCRAKGVLLMHEDIAGKGPYRAVGVPQAKRRSVIPADQTLKLVRLELGVGTPDSLVRAHNLAQRCCESVEALLSRYEAVMSGSTGGWFSRKRPSQEQVQKVPSPS